MKLMPSKKPLSKGFTLVEILVVIVIIGTLVGITVVSPLMSDGGQKALQDESRRLQQLFQLAADHALLKGVELGFKSDGRRYEWFQFNEDENAWQPMEEGHFQQYEIPEGLTLDVKPEEDPFLNRKSTTTKGKSKQKKDKGKVTPDIVVYSDSQVTPFRMTLSDDSSKTPYYLVSDGFNGIEVKTEK
ncbi:type II secretion system minor pseudopilin GspH [Zooshikella harenae]|uniref:Type II secretion system protein H n=1 Tax=Zooshikella harenae TaxID=2827238 RepID=A0ABS5Z7C1_9GAMM|nr:type II secretion system minor pseudopilin GspH [Zooshikella harenae]MBU2709946.1 type II secretion system minor pseudopilin GspH [Zooshikella harenae]